MRSDAQKNQDHILAVARDVIAQHGADASFRQIARQAEVGLGTLQRHFPTREVLLDALLRARLDELTREADRLQKSDAPAEALVTWFRAGVKFVQSYGGVVDLMAAALADQHSALHVSCTTVRAAGAALLLRAQAAGLAREDIDGTDLFALMGGLGWIGDQPSFKPRSEHLVDVVAATILTDLRSLPKRS